MANWMGGLQGAGGGALSGAGALSALGPIGAGVGAVGGGLLGLISGLTGGGKSGKFKRMPTTPEEQQVFDLSRSLGMQNLQDPYAGFAPIENETIAGFNQKILPSIAERFGGMGDNRLSSGAFRSQQLGAGVDLARSLAAMRTQFGQQNIQNALQQLQFGLTPYSSQYYRSEVPGLGEQLLRGGIQQAPGIATGLQDYKQRQQGLEREAAQSQQNQQLINLIKQLITQRGG